MEIEYGFGYIIIRSPYTPYSIYLRRTIASPISGHLPLLRHWDRLQPRMKDPIPRDLGVSRMRPPRLYWDNGKENGSYYNGLYWFRGWGLGLTKYDKILPKKGPLLGNPHPTYRLNTPYMTPRNPAKGTPRNFSYVWPQPRSWTQK